MIDKPASADGGPDHCLARPGSGAEHTAAHPPPRHQPGLQQHPQMPAEQYPGWP
ncbi:hypothetical protein [Actinoplanes ianthinogenes]|uniref:hypothetical protein n=1 Tax=Actinoplanes ianthinogenes TaxID=122358 RepID=UPI0016714392|nr:hypothetical protein [Actinoplanes ianthinogenes]